MSDETGQRGPHGEPRWYTQWNGDSNVVDDDDESDRHGGGVKKHTPNGRGSDDEEKSQPEEARHIEAPKLPCTWKVILKKTGKSKREGRHTRQRHN